jgi:hypothetical protein
MTRSSRAALIVTLLFGILCLPTRASAQQRPAIAEKIAKTYGLESWGQVDALRYTFNFEWGKFKLHRSWVWEPKTDQVTYEGPDNAGKPIKVTYKRSALASQDDVVKNVVDPGFLNDQYVLLFPLHLAWDTGPTIEDAGMQKLPLGKGKARKVVVKYPSEGGYTPGDTWTLFVGDDARIQEWHYQRGGPVKPSVVIATWAGHKMAGPLLVSLDRRGKADGKPVRIWYTNVAVRQVGSAAWMEAK